MNKKLDLDDLIEDILTSDFHTGKTKIFQFAKTKCLEAIRNTRHRATELSIIYAENAEDHIMNIRNQDVLPKELQ